MLSVYVACFYVCVCLSKILSFPPYFVGLEIQTSVVSKEKLEFTFSQLVNHDSKVRDNAKPQYH